MRILIKFIWRNIQEKKLRTFLILISVALSAALFFAATAIAGTIEGMYLQRIKKYYGTAELIVHPNEKSPSGFFHVHPAEQYRNFTDYAIGVIESSGTYKNRHESADFDLKGFRLADLATMNPYVLARQRQLLPFQGKKIIISRAMAEKFHFRIGQNIELWLRDHRYRFRIAAIAEPVGLFQDDGLSNTAVVPRETLAALFGARGKVTTVFIKLKDPSRAEEMVAKMSGAFRRYTVRETVSRSELRREIGTISTPFMMMVILVLFMSVFIIYTSFKVITRERLPLIGTFRSIGATRRMTDLILFAESLLYGVVGGVAGCGMGLGILYVMSILMTPAWLAGKLNTVMKFTPLQLLMALALAVILALGSSLFPIIRISKIPVKEIILNAIARPVRKKGRRLLWGALLLAVALAVPPLVPQDVTFLATVAGMLLTTSAVILWIPFLTKLLTGALERIYQPLFGNLAVLAAKNLRDNQSSMNNIALLAIGISSLLMINTLSYSVSKEVMSLYRDAQYDIWMWSWQPDRAFKQRLLAVDGVKGVYGVYSAYQAELDGRKDKIGWLVGAAPEFFDYWKLNILGDRRALLAQLDQDRQILLTASLRDKFGVKLGDYLTLQTKRGKKAYRISGFFTSLMENGSFAIIPERYFKLDMKEQYYNSLFIKTLGDPAAVESKLQQKFEREQPYITTLRSMEQRNMQSNAQMFLILQGFSVLALLIGIFGVLNNLLIGFIERQRSLAVLRSVGMSNRQSLQMILLESLSGGLIGGAVGVMSGLLLLSLIPYVMKSLSIPIPMHYSPAQFLFALLAGVVITVVASLSPALKSVKLNIIEAIKYE
ncbi:putative ABC transport system permease protein [Hydrogenispora ethanolica]|jgi:putative ABC transport system permease protein|uniref:Putative ABC transport system permease protein n=1 Tax=Hydrogenispora ethanolica TaxID=1082276 RepID=A0A4R1RM44_HYDET|nr:ABC transporter permease [Hydrogenispora ethanolica]TCL67323.1 putative ABC transport system permease protein [Hydrogenispora ethanolica]